MYVLVTLTFAVDPQLAQVVVQLVARHREQVGAKARLLAELVLGGDAGEQGLLHQLLGIGSALGGEEPAQTVEVPVDQRLAGGLVAALPAVEKLKVRFHAETIPDAAIGSPTSDRMRSATASSQWI